MSETTLERDLLSFLAHCNASLVLLNICLLYLKSSRNISCSPFLSLGTGARNRSCDV